MKTRIKAVQTLHRQRPRYLMRLAIALATGLIGLADMLSIIFPKPNWDMVLGTWPVNTHYGMHKLIVVCGFVLLMLFSGLMRGKREGAGCATRALFALLSSEERPSFDLAWVPCPPWRSGCCDPLYHRRFFALV